MVLTGALVDVVRRVWIPGLHVEGASDGEIVAAVTCPFVFNLKEPLVNLCMYAKLNRLGTVVDHLVKNGCIVKRRSLWLRRTMRMAITRRTIHRV